MSTAAVAPVTPAPLPVSAPPRPYTDRLLNLLQLFARCRGRLSLQSLPLGGGAATHSVFPLPIPALPRNILDAILANDGIRFGPVTRSGTDDSDLPAAFVIWRLGNQSDPETERPYMVPPEDHAKVGAALADFPLARPAHRRRA